MCSPPGMPHEYGSVHTGSPPITKCAGTKTTQTEDRKPSTSHSVTEYADVTIFVTSTADFPIIEDATHLSEQASGALLNPRKSKAIAVGGWCTRETVLRIDYHTHATILGITIWGTIAQTINDSWARLTTKVRLKAKQAYTRDQCIAHRICYIHGFLLSKLWYIAQVLPEVRPYTQQLSTPITWYIWRGAVFRVPVSTLQKPKKKGGWGLLDLEAQCRALLLCRTYVQSKKEGTMMVAWMESWGLTKRQPNPPNANRTLKHFILSVHLCHRYGIHHVT